MDCLSTELEAALCFRRMSSGPAEDPAAYSNWFSRCKLAPC
jgi:hypothetical protein